MKTTVATCDVCGKPVSTRRSLSLMAVVTVRARREAVRSGDFPDVCSAQCAHRLLDTLIAEASL